MEREGKTGASRSPRRARGLRLTAALAVTCAGVLAAGPASALADCANAEVEASEQDVAALERSLLCLINERRSNAGVATVRPSLQLEQAAAKHSSAMVDKGFFSHDSPDGQSFVDRITASGYTKGARSWLVGENLVWGSGEYSTPASMVRAWMESPAHRDNLLRDRFRDIGIAAVRGTPYAAGDSAGVTVSSDYGRRKVKQHGSRKARKAKARKAKARKAKARKAKARA